MRLIMEDLEQNRAAAIDTMLRSMKYGDRQFILDPDDEPAYDSSILDACRTIPSVGPCDPHTNNVYRITSGMTASTLRKRITRETSPLVDNAGVADNGEDIDDGHDGKRRKVSQE